MSISKTFGEIIATTEINKGYTDKRQHISFHSMRHTFASWLAIQGESILTIGALLGHKSVSMTKRYAHLSPDHKRRAVELLEKSFSQKAEKAK
jgi:integrase